jgi:predicted transcriptional regulator
MRGRNIQRAIEAVKEKGVDTDLELYDKIEKIPGNSIYHLAKVMDWTRGKTYTAARRLEKAGMVHIEKAEKNGRAVLIVKPKAWHEYFTPEELEEFKKMEI